MVHDQSSFEEVGTSLIRVCQPDVSGGPMNLTTLGNFTSSGTVGDGTGLIGELSEDIDLQSCHYFVVVGLGSCTGEDRAIQKVRAQWRRQISPAPATATFGDVPTSHLFFQQIEALAASGITSGCGDDDFCPNAPLIRAQMAAFLAKALELHWGEISQD